MKTKRTRNFNSLAILGILAVSGQWAAAQLPTGTSFKMNAGTVDNIGQVELADPGNHFWKLQSTTDFSTWTDVETWKVHNGRFTKSIQRTGAPAGQFFRMVFDPAQQTGTSTVANGLSIPTPLANYASPTLPPSFLQQPILGQDNTPVNNPVTDPAATLGRVLFYDKRLSFNNTVSCASCHQQANGFSDPKQFSVGFNGGLTGRNSMGLANARWYQRVKFFWDERAATLEAQVLQPIQNSVEMGMTLSALQTKLAAEPYYQTLFTNAFGTSAVTSDRISKALAQFVRSIVSTQTKFDVGAATGFSNFTAEENQGRTIFNTASQGNCAACHGTDNFVPGGAINNNGLENPYVDKGVGALTGLAQDEGLFKVPSLRNIALTAPYMHDGRFATLEEVVEFYNSGVVAHPNLSGPLRNPGGGPVQPRRLNLTAAQKAALVAFMRTLTDTSVGTDVKFSDPFQYGN